MTNYLKRPTKRSGERGALKPFPFRNRAPEPIFKIDFQNTVSRVFSLKPGWRLYQKRFVTSNTPRFYFSNPKHLFPQKPKNFIIKELFLGVFSHVILSPFILDSALWCAFVCFVEYRRNKAFLMPFGALRIPSKPTMAAGHGMGPDA